MIILGNKHSGKRSLVDSLFDISKTTIHNKRLAAQIDANKMRLKGLTTAIDYAYLNVLDLTDVDYRTFLMMCRHAYKAVGVHDRGAWEPANIQPVGEQIVTEEGGDNNNVGLY